MGVIFGLFMMGNSFPSSKMRFGAKSARALSTFFLKWMVLGVIFGGFFLVNSLINAKILSNAINQALLGTYELFI